MMSLEEIKRKSNKAAVRAAAEKKRPYTPYDVEEIKGYGENPIPFPVIGDYQPPGWRLVDTWFVDSSGAGLDAEPALTLPKFKARLLENLRAGLDYGYALIEVGQFQVYVGVFERGLRLVHSRP